MNAGDNPKLVLPVGTQVVTAVEIKDTQGNCLRRSGAVGKIVHSPSDNEHLYTIQFPDGEVADLYRHELAVRKHVQKLSFDRPGAQPGDKDLYEYIIFKCIVGSQAYGLNTEASDIDRRGIYLPPAHLHWSLYGLPEQLDNPEAEECYFELQKFLVLALKANPNVLECLYTPLVELATPIAQELLDHKQVFLSKFIYQTFNGYVLSQFRKLEQDLRTRGELKWKHVMHLLRLLLTGITVLEEAVVPVEVTEHREKLLAIRAGKIPWTDLNQWRLELHKRFDRAYETTKLPARPDYAWCDQFLIRARAQMVKHDH